MLRSCNIREFTGRNPFEVYINYKPITFGVIIYNEEKFEY